MKLEIDQYAHLDSPIHRWDTRYKLVGMSALIFAIAVVESIPLLLVVVGMTAALYGLAQLPLGYWQQRLRYPGFFLLGVVGVLPFLSGETILWQWGWLTVRQEGSLALLLVAGRFLSIVTMTLILFGTTPFLQTVKAMRALGLPSLFTDMILLSYRYLYEFADQLAQMQQAMRLRGFGMGRSRRRLPFVPDPRALGVFASLAGTLFIRSYEQSERVYTAMRLRGYGASLPERVRQFARADATRDYVSLAATGLSLVGAIAIILAELLWFQP